MRFENLLLMMPPAVVMSRLAVLLGLLSLSACLRADLIPPTDTSPSVAARNDTGVCGVKSLKESTVQGLKVFAPDGQSFLINKEDEEGTAQLYRGALGQAGLTCITCEEYPGGPKRQRFKMQPAWHPSGRWIFVAVERDQFTAPPVLGWDRNYIEGMLQSGLWVDMYAMTPDGKRWQRLTDFQSGVQGVADGYTGPALTPDGRIAVWSQIMDGNVLTYTFGRWALVRADIVEEVGMPRLANRRDITPKGMHWNEPGNFHPDGQSLLITGSTAENARGMDQYVLNINSGALVNLTNSPNVWDEHGLYAPDGKAIIFMSAYPYRQNPNSSKILSIQTEFMLRQADGKLTQLTQYRTRGAPEFSEGIAATPSWAPDGRSASLAQLFFPNYKYWDLTFNGACGKQ